MGERITEPREKMENTDYDFHIERFLAGYNAGDEETQKASLEILKNFARRSPESKEALCEGIRWQIENSRPPVGRERKDRQGLEALLGEIEKNI